MAHSPLTGRVAIVTGASRGIGRGIAVHLSSLGANLVINYLSSASEADLIVSELNANSSTPRAIAVQADISDPSAVKSLFDEAEAAFGSPVHILINNAGMMYKKNPISSTTLEDFDAVFNVNARGAFLCCREAAGRIARGGGGRIVMVTSSFVGASMPTIGPYAAAKAAVEEMTKTVAKELKGTMITANCVAPGPVKTSLLFGGVSEEALSRMAAGNPMGRIGENKDVASLVGFLCSDEAEWINGQVIRVNGGII